jgi:hypothetical protein
VVPSKAQIHQFAFVAYSRQCMADDTEHFLRHVDPEPMAALGRNGPSAAATGSPLQRVRELSLLCEERYLAWREHEPRASLGVTRTTYDMMASQVEEFLPRIAVGLVAAGHRGLTAEAMRHAEEAFGYLSSVAVLRRAAERLHADSHGYDQARLDEMCRISNEDFVDDPDGAGIDYPRLRRALDRNESLALGWGEGHRSFRQQTRRSVRHERRVVNRSLKASEQFLGAATTRLFVSGKSVRITGRLATYAVWRSGDLLSDHGGATVSVYNRAGDVFLCRLCIYTKGVPLLDHLTSLFVHIKAGQEECILREGNPYDVAPEAKDEPWLVPYLERSEAPVRLADERDGRDLPHRPLIRNLAAHFFEDLGDACPPMPETRDMLEQGYTSEDRVCVVLGQQRLAAIVAARQEAAKATGEAALA